MNSVFHHDLAKRVPVFGLPDLVFSKPGVRFELHDHVAPLDATTLGDVVLFFVAEHYLSGLEVLQVKTWRSAFTGAALYLSLEVEFVRLVVPCILFDQEVSEPY